MPVAGGGGKGCLLWLQVLHFEIDPLWVFIFGEMAGQKKPAGEGGQDRDLNNELVRLATGQISDDLGRGEDLGRCGEDRHGSHDRPEVRGVCSERMHCVCDSGVGLYSGGVSGDVGVDLGHAGCSRSHHGWYDRC